METRPTAMYRVPWQTARQERLRRSLGKLQAPMARPTGTPDDRAPGDGSPNDRADDRADAPDMRWPSLTGRGPRHIPVVGPTEALRGRAGGPGVDVPPGAVPGLLDHERESGWQLAQRVWQDSGVDWEWEERPRNRTTLRARTRPPPTERISTQPIRTQPRRTPARSRATRTGPTLTPSRPTHTSPTLTGPTLTTLTLTLPGGRSQPGPPVLGGTARGKPVPDRPAPDSA